MPPSLATQALGYGGSRHPRCIMHVNACCPQRNLVQSICLRLKTQESFHCENREDVRGNPRSCCLIPSRSSVTEMSSPPSVAEAPTPLSHLSSLLPPPQPASCARLCFSARPSLSLMDLGRLWAWQWSLGRPPGAVAQRAL